MRGLVATARRLAMLSLLVLTGMVTAPVMAAPRYSAFMVDANSREVLYANAADEPRHPASLTKMMTLYLVFDALESGRLRLADPVVVSRLAASQAPSRLGLAVGQSISVDNAISVVAVKSANDIAVALAERIGGSVPRFVQMMNLRAASLGMRNTHFANPNGLTDPTNLTTARDLTILGLALIRNHPRYYRYFGERDFMWQRNMLINHNHLLGKMIGMDGIKTGYTVDAGFTLAASAVRGNRRLVAVVMGEPSLVARSRDVSALLEAGFSVLDRRALGQQVTVAGVLPTLDHPALRVEPVVEQGSSDDDVARPRTPRLLAAPRRHIEVSRAPRPATGRHKPRADRAENRRHTKASAHAGGHQSKGHPKGTKAAKAHDKAAKPAKAHKRHR